MAKSGFVAAALSEPAPAPKQAHWTGRLDGLPALCATHFHHVEAPKDDGSSDEDLFAPGVTCTQSV